MTAAPGDLADVVDIARPVVERIVWCTVTTVSPVGEPRSRLMHPVWFWDGAVPWAFVTARPTPTKRRHLAANDRLACFYWDPQHDSVAIDATAVWVDRTEVAGAWDRIASTPPPVGFDPALIWPDGPDSPDCAMLRFTARRIVATPAGRPGHMWTA